MNTILPIIKPLIIDAVASRQAARKNMAGIGIWIISGCLALSGIIFLALGGFFALQDSFSRDVAALLTGMVIIAASIFVSLWGQKLLSRKNEKEKNEQAEEVKNLLNDVLDTVGHEVDESIDKNPKTAVLVSGMAGLLAGQLRS